jgi:hypothetical protein
MPFMGDIISGIIPSRKMSKSLPEFHRWLPEGDFSFPDYPKV